MANSRSNIYPVQLQGAELNLNKLDAEIKQYSGFNKNNAPFVGGCLSNIFTKDETIEGATSKNTYIAPNGDVYRVNTEGLWKNEEKLIDTSEAEFFDVVDLGADAFPDTSVYVYDEETYIYVKDEKYFYHSGNVDHDFISAYGETIDINAYRKSCYNIIKRVIDDEEYDVVGMQIGYTTLYVSIYKKNTDGTLNTVYTYKVSTPPINSGEEFIFKAQGDSINNFRLAVFNKKRNDSSNNCFVLGFNNSQLEKIGNLSVKFLSGTEDNTVALEYCYTNKKAYYFKTGPNGRVPLNIICDYTIDFTNLKIILDDPYVVSNEKYSQPEFSYYVKTSLIKKYGCCYPLLLRAKNVTSGDYFYYKSVDDLVTSYGYCEYANSRYTASNDIGCIVHNCILLNNGVVSGIALPGGYILASEWNSVSDKLIFFGEDNNDWYENNYYCLWQNINTKHWYKLKKSAPKLKLINNQIIINTNGVINSYDYKRNKVLEFAPAWNNRRPDYDDFTATEITEQWYMATSINEYALENNSSIIINPVLVSNRFVGSSEIYEKVSKDGVWFNLYAGTVEVKYYYSFEVGKTITYKTQDPDLIGLPFPTNTDGNIQYSPSLFAAEKGKYGNLVFISEGGTAYKLMTYDNKAVMSYFLSTAVEGLQDFFTIQGQLYGILDNQIYNFSIVNEIANRGDFIVSVEGLQFVGNTPYEALFFSKTNRCLYSFTGANVLNAKQFVDKISEVRNYKYNPATQSIFLITDIGVIVYSLFGIYQIEFLNCQDMYLLNNGVILTDNEGTFKYVKYYKEETTEDYTKENITLETCFYGMNNQTVTINDCLYMRIFSEEHEEGNLEVSATTLSLEGRMTEKTTFRIKERDWDKLTHTIYLRYQPKEQRGLGISFSINSPFKIASLSIGSQADAILIDKVSKGAINAPQITSNNVEW